MSEPNEGPRQRLLGSWHAPTALGSALLIAGLWTAYGIGIRSTDARTAPTLQAPSDTARIAKLLCTRLDSAPTDSSLVTFRAHRADCFRRAANITLFRSPDLLDIHWTIPEFHDYQQLRDGPMPADPDTPGATKFGPLASAYAVPQIGGYRHMHQIEEQGPLGALVAYVVVDQPAVSATGLPDSYRRLNLQVGVNCVWLSHEPGAPANLKWQGHVAPAGPLNKCEHAGPLPLPALDVHRASPSSILDDYPPVVRFGEGTVQSPSSTSFVQPLLGVRCLDGWCEIGPAGFKDGTAIPPSAFAGLPLGARERKIKGWYDDQWLGDDSAHEPLLRAAIIPRPKIDRYAAADFGTRQHVATIYLFTTPPPTSSHANWGLTQGTNEIWLERDLTGNWKSSLKSAAGTTTWFVDRTVHHDEAVPGTARFHWSNSPNPAWTPCGEACCEIRGFA